MSTYTELAKKLKALADTGIGGEKENAQKMLDKLMKKHGISIDDINNIKRVRCFFRLKKEQGKLFNQVCYSVMGKDHQGVWNLKKSHYHFIYASKAEEIEIRFKFNLYWRAWVEDLRIFYKAFINQNNIFPDPDKAREDIKKEPPNFDELVKMAAMMGGIEKREVVKQLPDKL